MMRFEPKKTPFREKSKEPIKLPELIKNRHEAAKKRDVTFESNYV